MKRQPEFALNGRKSLSQRVILLVSLTNGEKYILRAMQASNSGNTRHILDSVLLCLLIVAKVRCGPEIWYITFRMGLWFSAQEWLPEVLAPKEWGTRGGKECKCAGCSLCKVPSQMVKWRWKSPPPNVHLTKLDSLCLCKGHLLLITQRC